MTLPQCLVIKIVSFILGIILHDMTWYKVSIRNNIGEPPRWFSHKEII